MMVGIKGAEWSIYKFKDVIGLYQRVCVVVGVGLRLCRGRGLMVLIWWGVCDVCGGASRGGTNSG